MGRTIDKLTIEGFKSIRELEDFELRALNVLIGANGAGKSNFVDFFRMLREMVEQRLQVFVATTGGADAYLYMGPKVTRSVVGRLHFGANGYEFSLMPTADDRLVFGKEMALYTGGQLTSDYSEPLGSGHRESRLKDRKDDLGSIGRRGVPSYVYEAVSSWVVYHFHDTSATAGVRRPGPTNDNLFLRPEAQNLAAFLYRLSQTNPTSYSKIRDVVRLAAPFFDDFKLRPDRLNEDQIKLEWAQKDSDNLFSASQLSDGTLRFICLATALLQPSLPPTVLFDEPELGLHPYALTLVANLFKQTARQSGKLALQQVIVSTQSASLLSEFEPEDVVVVERVKGQSTFRRLESAQLSDWLQEYSLGELWQKNVLGGRPRADDAPRLSEPTSGPPVAPHR